jgi:hypothetical protein
MEGRLTGMPHVNELHDQHDQILVVSFASGDLAADDRDRATAQSLVDSCAECARLHDDVIAIARATQALPPAVRTRDFQISPEQAAKLQPGGWRRFVAAFAAPGSIFSKQLGVGMATLGIVGLLIGASPSIQLGMGGSAAASPAPAAAGAERAPAYTTAQPGAVELPGVAVSSPAASGPAASYAPAAGGAQAAASPSEGFDTLASEPTRNVADTGSKAKAAPTARHPTAGNPGDQNGGGGAVVSPAPAPEPSSTNGPSGLVIASSILLAAGLLVLLLRSIGRRAAAG